MAFVVVVSVSADKFDDICKEKHDGKFIRNPDDCSRYFECDGAVIKNRHACWDDTLFDLKNGTCQPPDDVTCENVIINVFNVHPVLKSHVNSFNSMLYSI